MHIIRIILFIVWIFIPLQQHWREYSDAVVRVWLDEWVGACVHPSVRRTLPCGNDTDYSFRPITFKLHMFVYYDEGRNPIDLGQRSRSTLALCLWNLVGKIQTTYFALSLSNYTCQLLMMRGRTRLILGHGVKGQGQLYMCQQRSTLALCIENFVGTIQTTVLVQSLSNITCKLWMMRGRTLLIFGHGFKGQGQLWHSAFETL